MRIGQIAGGVDLMGTHVAHQINEDFNVVWSEWFLLDTTGLIKRHVQKMQLLIRNAATPSPSPGFAPTNESFNLLNFFAVNLASLLLI